MNTTAQATPTATIPPLATVKSEATIAAHVATLNALRKAHNLPPLKAWKESKAKLLAAIAKLRKATPVEAIDNGKPKAADDLAIPDYLKHKPEDRKGAWAALKPSASSVTLKSVAISKPLTDDQKKIAEANKGQGKKKSTNERARYDWEAAEAKAKTGVLPTPPDLSAPTHKHYVGKLNEIATLARTGKLAELRAYKVSDRSDGSPGLVKRYQAIAVKTLAAKAKG